MKIKFFPFVFFISMIILFNVSNVYAMKATTVSNSCACFAQSDMEDMIDFVSVKDRASFQAYLNMGKCIILKGGLDVTVTKSPGMFGGYSEFVFRGIKMWTTREGLTNYRAE